VGRYKAGNSPIDSDSPTGPAAHGQWDDPLKLEGSARARAREAAGLEGPPPITPSPPRITAEWHEGGIRLRYQVFPTQRDRWPDGLVVTINSPDEAEPPTTERFPIHEHEGRVELSTQVNPAYRYDVFVSAVTPDALASVSVRVDLSPQGGDR
jgi:hypothetical protein